MNATYNNIAVDLIIHSRTRAAANDKDNLSGIAWEIVKTLKITRKGQSVWGLLSNAMRAVWAWAKDMRKVAVTAAAMVMAKNSDIKMSDFDSAKNKTTPKERIDIAVKECPYGPKGIQKLIWAEAKEMEGKPSLDEIIEALWRRYLQAKARYFSRDGHYTFSTYCNYRISKLA